MIENGMLVNRQTEYDRERYIKKLIQAECDRERYVCKFLLVQAKYV